MGPEIIAQILPAITVFSIMIKLKMGILIEKKVIIYFAYSSKAFFI